MKNRSFRIFALLLALITLLGLTGCGDDKSLVTFLNFGDQSFDSEYVNGKVCENDRFELNWDDSLKRVSFVDKQSGAVCTVLFDRYKKSLQITPEGKKLLGWTITTFETLQSMRSAVGTTDGRLHVFVVADDLTHFDDLFQFFNVGIGEVAEDVAADADFERYAKFEDVAQRRFVHQQRIDAPLHAAEQRRFAQHHAFLCARNDHAGHLEATQRFAQHWTPYA